MAIPSDWAHDREHVRLLQHAHADHIEASYRAMLALPGNPGGVIVGNVGPVRTFIAAGERLENRAIFSGDESVDQIDAVLRHFAEHGANLVIEVNPANYYVDPPRTWEKRLLAHLLSRGCAIHDFRCVWVCCDPQGVEEPGERFRFGSYGAEDIDAAIEASRTVRPKQKWDALSRAAAAHGGLTQYVAYDGDQPCGIGSLFVNGRGVGYLQWWYTHPDHRGRGVQQAGIRRRVRDAFAKGCTHLFTVTDFNITSPANLQRCGFRLAYNYLLVRRAPPPIA